MNMNWLGFSLSPQEDDHAPISHQLADQETLASRLGFNSNEIHGAGGGTDVSGGGSSECFDLTNSDSTASVNHHLTPSIFGIHEAAAFNRNNDHIHSQDWNMKGAGMNSSDSNNYKRTSSSDLSTMLMGSNTTTSTSCSIISQQVNLENHHQQLPKLENFLGRHSFADHDRSSAGHDYMFDMNNGPGPVSSNEMNTKTNSNNIGLSMIKTWLRNQPSQPRDNHHQLEQESKNSKESRNQPQSSLSLSMGTGSLQTVTTATAGGAATAATGETTCSSDKNTKQSPVVTATTTTGTDAQTQSTGGAIEAVPRKAIDTFGQRTSIYRGVTRHRWTGRYEAHLWDNSCRREGQTRKGRQVYLGGYDKEDKAARAYDLAALKYWGTTTTTNFPISSYEKEIDEMKPMTRQEYVASLRRKSSGFSRGASIYRGVTRHHQHGRWQARIGRVAGNKDLYLGTFSTQEEAAEAYDIAAIKFRGLNAVTNFDMSRYDVKSILESSALPITTGATAKRLKDVQQQQPPPPGDHHHQIMLSSVLDHHGQIIRSSSSTEHDIMSNVYSAYGSYGAQQGCSWPTLAFNQAQAQAAAAPHQAPFAAGINGMQLHYSPYGYGYGNAHAQRVWCKQEQDTNSNQESSFHHQDDDHLRQQLQLGGTHNFFHDHDQQQQQQTGGLMGLMDSSAASMEHSSGSNSVIYSGGDHHGNNNGYGSSTTGTGGGYIMPMVMSTVVANDDQNQADGNNNNINGFEDGDDQEANIKAQQLGYDHHHQNMFLGSSSTIDPAYQHHASNRNLYYHLPVQDDQHESSSVAVATSSTTCNMNWVPTAVPTLAHPTFTVWNDT